MRYVGFFVGHVPSIDRVVHKAKRAGLATEFLLSNRIPLNGVPSFSYRLGIGIDWYFLEADTENNIYNYADKIFSGLEENETPWMDEIYAFYEDKDPRQLKLF